MQTVEPADGVPLVFSALDADVAGPTEVAWAEAGSLVVSNAKSHRMDADVPLLVITHDAGRYWPAHELRKRSGTIQVTISPPILPNGRDSKALTEQAREVMSAAVAAIARPPA